MIPQILMPGVSTADGLAMSARMWSSLWDQSFGGLLGRPPRLDSVDAARSGMLVLPALSGVSGTLDDWQVTRACVAANESAIWHRAGRPTFSLTHSCTASLILTDVRGVQMDQLRMPFDVLLVTIPPGFLVIESDGRTHDLCAFSISRTTLFHQSCDRAAAREISRLVREQLLASAAGNRPLFAELGRRIDEIASGMPTSSWLHVDSVSPGRSMLHKTLADGKTVEAAIADSNADYVGISSDEERATADALGRLATNVLLYINSTHDQPWSARSERRGAAAGEDVVRAPSVWTLGREIKLSREMRDAAVALSHSGRRPREWKLHRAFVVRGHWRNQACGKRHSDRKLIWVKPFWKGPDSAVGIVRRYDVGASS